MTDLLQQELAYAAAIKILSRLGMEHCDGSTFAYLKVGHAKSYLQTQQAFVTAKLGAYFAEGVTA